MEHSLGKSRWQDLEIKKEVTENFYFDEERCNYINDVKQVIHLLLFSTLIKLTYSSCLYYK